jgi:hypothetical protein
MYSCMQVPGRFGTIWVGRIRKDAKGYINHKAIDIMIAVPVPKLCIHVYSMDTVLSLLVLLLVNNYLAI